MHSITHLDTLKQKYSGTLLTQERQTYSLAQIRSQQTQIKMFQSLTFDLTFKWC